MYTAMQRSSLGFATDSQLAKFASDKFCSNKEECAEQLRLRNLELIELAKNIALSASTRLICNQIRSSEQNMERQTSRIVGHMWIIAALLPFVLGIVAASLSHRQRRSLCTRSSV